MNHHVIDHRAGRKPRPIPLHPMKTGTHGASGPRGSIMDCGGKSDATPLSYRAPVPKRRRVRLAGALQNAGATTEAPPHSTDAMKTNRPRRSHFHRSACLALLAGCLAAGLAAAHAAPPSLQPLHPGKWPEWPRGGFALDVKVAGNYAYVALSAAGLGVIDLRNPTIPVQVGGCDTSGQAWAVAVLGNYAYVADGHAGLQVIDVRDPTHCVRVGGYDTSGYAFGVAASGNYAYVADWYAGLQVIDVSNPANPVRVGGYVTSGEAYGVAVSGNYAYVADYYDGLQVIDVCDPPTACAWAATTPAGMPLAWRCRATTPTWPIWVPACT